MPCSLLVAMSGTRPLFAIAAARTFAKDSSESMTRIRLAMACFFCLSLESREYEPGAGSVNETQGITGSAERRCLGRGAGLSAQLGRLHELEHVLLVEIGDELIDDLVGLPGDHIVAAAPTEPHLSIGDLPGGAGQRRLFRIVDDHQRDASAGALEIVGDDRGRM